jgi:hypothetical protein
VTVLLTPEDGYFKVHIGKMNSIDGEKTPFGEETPLTDSARTLRRGNKSDIDHHQRGGNGLVIRSLPERLLTGGAICAALLALVMCTLLLTIDFTGGANSWGSNSSRGPLWNESEDASPGGLKINGSMFLAQVSDREQLYFDDLGRFILRDYDVQPTFSDFLPALAGYYGKPLYAFYVNRGQGIASFGVRSKDYPIMEFQSANKAYQNTALVGFRTFLQLYPRRRGNSNVWSVLEPFSALNTRHPNRLTQTEVDKLPKRFMYVGSNEIQLQELDLEHGIETNVTFFILPEEDFGAFVKRTTIRNLNSRLPLTLSLLDGLAKIEPAGGKMDALLKNMGRTLEGWMGVYHPYDNSLSMPFYRLSSKPTDSARVEEQVAGHWCLSVLERGDPSLLPIVFDPFKVFGSDSSLIYPLSLYETPIGDIIIGKQYGAAKTASAFAAVDRFTLGPGESLTLSTFYGMAQHILDVPVIARRIVQPGFVQYKMTRTREIIAQITASVETKTAIPLFDGHVQQMFLDNSLRGGMPSILGDVDDDAKMRNADEDGRLKVFHFFSRAHGDLERDYNEFEVLPTFFSEVRPCSCTSVLHSEWMMLTMLIYAPGARKLPRRNPESEKRCCLQPDNWWVRRQNVFIFCPE